MQQRAFTLIETLIASSIVVVILGAAVVSNRVIQESASRTDDRTVMEALADQSMEIIRGYQIVLPTLNLGNNARMNIPINDATTDRYGMFIATQIGNGCSPAGGQCKEVPNGGPILMTWCDDQNPGSCQTNYRSNVKVSAACLATGCTAAQIFSYVQSQVPAADSGDVIAVRRTPYSGAGSNNNRMVVDFTSPLIAGSTIDMTNTNSKADWDFYVKTIKMSRQGRNQASVGYTPASGNDLQKSRRSLYVVIVTIFNINNPNSKVIRTQTFTDWQ